VLEVIYSSIHALARASLKLFLFQLGLTILCTNSKLPCRSQDSGIILFLFCRSRHLVYNGKMGQLKILKVDPEMDVLSQVTTIFNKQSLADPLCFVCAMKCLYPKVVSKSVYLEPKQILPNTYNTLIYNICTYAIIDNARKLHRNMLLMLPMGTGRLILQ